MWRASHSSEGLVAEDGTQVTLKPQDDGTLFALEPDTNRIYSAFVPVSSISISWPPSMNTLLRVTTTHENTFDLSANVTSGTVSGRCNPGVIEYSCTGLPEWMEFDALACTLKGKAPVTEVGTLQFEMRAKIGYSDAMKSHPYKQGDGIGAVATLQLQIAIDADEAFSWPIEIMATGTSTVVLDVKPGYGVEYTLGEDSPPNTSLLGNTLTCGISTTPTDISITATATYMDIVQTETRILTVTPLYWITDSYLGDGKTTPHTPSLSLYSGGKEAIIQSTNTPPGLALSREGIITGAPLESGTFVFTATAACSGVTISKEFTISLDVSPFKWSDDLFVTSEEIDGAYFAVNAEPMLNVTYLSDQSISSPHTLEGNMLHVQYEPEERYITITATRAIYYLVLQDTHTFKVSPLYWKGSNVINGTPEHPYTTMLEVESGTTAPIFTSTTHMPPGMLLSSTDGSILGLPSESATTDVKIHASIFATDKSISRTYTFDFDLSTVRSITPSDLGRIYYGETRLIQLEVTPSTGTISFIQSTSPDDFTVTATGLITCAYDPVLTNIPITVKRTLYDFHNTVDLAYTVDPGYWTRTLEAGTWFGGIDTSVQTMHQSLKHIPHSWEHLSISPLDGRIHGIFDVALSLTDTIIPIHSRVPAYAILTATPSTTLPIKGLESPLGAPLDLLITPLVDDVTPRFGYCQLHSPCTLSIPGIATTPANPHITVVVHIRIDPGSTEGTIISLLCDDGSSISLGYLASHDSLLWNVTKADTSSHNLSPTPNIGQWHTFTLQYSASTLSVVQDTDPSHIPLTYPITISGAVVGPFDGDMSHAVAYDLQLNHTHTLGLHGILEEYHHDLIFGNIATYLPQTSAEHIASSTIPLTFSTTSGREPIPSDGYITFNDTSRLDVAHTDPSKYKTLVTRMRAKVSTTDTLTTVEPMVYTVLSCRSEAYPSLDLTATSVDNLLHMTLTVQNQVMDVTFADSSKWHTLILEFGPRSVSMYFNGVLCGTVPSDPPDLSLLTICGGDLSHILLYGSQLSSEDVLTLHDSISNDTLSMLSTRISAPGLSPVLANSMMLTPVSDSGEEPSRRGGYVSFASGNKIRFGQLPAMDNMTVLVREKHLDGDVSRMSHLLHFGTNAINAPTLHLQLLSHSRMWLQVSEYKEGHAVTNVPSGKWVTHAVVCEGPNVSYYQDGTKLASITRPIPSMAIENSYIGPAGFIGDISHCVVYDTALSDDDVGIASRAIHEPVVTYQHKLKLKTAANVIQSGGLTSTITRSLDLISTSATGTEPEILNGQLRFTGQPYQCIRYVNNYSFSHVSIVMRVLLESHPDSTDTTRTLLSFNDTHTPSIRVTLGNESISLLAGEAALLSDVTYDLWVTLVLVATSTSAIIYINGSSAGEIQFTPSHNWDLSDLTLGAKDDAASWVGSITHFIAYPSALSPGEVSGIHDEIIYPGPLGIRTLPHSVYRPLDTITGSSLTPTIPFHLSTCSVYDRVTKCSTSGVGNLGPTSLGYHTMMIRVRASGDIQHGEYIFGKDEFSLRRDGATDFLVAQMGTITSEAIPFPSADIWTWISMVMTQTKLLVYFDAELVSTTEHAISSFNVLLADLLIGGVPSTVASESNFAFQGDVSHFALFKRPLSEHEIANTVDDWMPVYHLFHPTQADNSLHYDFVTHGTLGSHRVQWHIEYDDGDDDPMWITVSATGLFEDAREYRLPTEDARLQRYLDHVTVASNSPTIGNYEIQTAAFRSSADSLVISNNDIPVISVSFYDTSTWRLTCSILHSQEIVFIKSSLPSGAVMHPGESLVSPDGATRLLITDMSINLTIEDILVWQIVAPIEYANDPIFFQLKQNNEAVLQTESGATLWRTNTFVRGDYASSEGYVRVVDGGNLVIEQSLDNVIWETGTSSKGLHTLSPTL